MAGRTHYPQWLRDADPAYDAETFLRHTVEERQLDLGCWHDGKFVAIASFFESFPRYVEMSVWASREARSDWLAPGIWEIGNSLFEGGVAEIYCVLARFHVANRRLALRCWMRFDGTRRLKATARGRIIEWMRYSITEEDWRTRQSNGQQAENHLERPERD